MNPFVIRADGLPFKPNFIQEGVVEMKFGRICGIMGTHGTTYGVVDSVVEVVSHLNIEVFEMTSGQ